MKLLFDQSLPPRLVDDLEPAFSGSLHVRDVALSEVSDQRVWEFAQQNDFALVTKGDDFDHRALTRGLPPKVVRLEPGASPIAAVGVALRSATAALLEFDRDPEASLLVLSIGRALTKGGTDETLSNQAPN